MAPAAGSPAADPLSRGVAIDPETLGTTNDFADWLSPMMVKELRQGLRSKSFTGFFILTQVLMIIGTFIAVGSAEIGVSDSMGPLFIGFLAIALLLVLPMRGFQAIPTEAADNTLDLLVLTRLQSLRIVVGKWIAIVAQSILAVVSVLPYILMRYFIGGVDLISELSIIAILLFLSAVIAAIAVGFSATSRSTNKRGSGILITLFVFFGISGVFNTLGLAGPAYSMFGFGLGETVGMVAVLFAVGGYLAYYFLDMGAGRMAPEAENHSTRKRLISLGIAAILVILVGLDVGDADSLWMSLLIGVLGLSCVDALTERASTVRSIFVPFAKRKMSFAAYFLAPGWHTGILYYVICYLLFAVAAILIAFDGASLQTDDFLFAITIIPAVIIFPVALIQLIFRSKLDSFRIYLLIQLFSCGIAFVLFAISEAQDSPAPLFLGSLIPHCCVGLMSYESSLETTACAIGGAVFLLCIAVILIRAAPLFKIISWHIKGAKAEQQLANSPIPTTTDETSAP